MHSVRQATHTVEDAEEAHRLAGHRVFRELDSITFFVNNSKLCQLGKLAGLGSHDRGASAGLIFSTACLQARQSSTKAHFTPEDNCTGSTNVWRPRSVSANMLQKKAHAPWPGRSPPCFGACL